MALGITETHYGFPDFVLARNKYSEGLEQCWMSRKKKRPPKGFRSGPPPGRDNAASNAGEPQQPPRKSRKPLFYTALTFSTIIFGLLARKVIDDKAKQIASNVGNQAKTSNLIATTNTTNSTIALNKLYEITEWFTARKRQLTREDLIKALLANGIDLNNNNEIDSNDNLALLISISNLEGIDVAYKDESYLASRQALKASLLNVQHGIQLFLKSLEKKYQLPVFDSDKPDMKQIIQMAEFVKKQSWFKPDEEVNKLLKPYMNHLHFLERTNPEGIGIIGPGHNKAHASTSVSVTSDEEYKVSVGFGEETIVDFQKYLLDVDAQKLFMAMLLKEAFHVYDAVVANKETWAHMYLVRENFLSLIKKEERDIKSGGFPSPKLLEEAMWFVALIVIEEAKGYDFMIQWLRKQGLDSEKLSVLTDEKFVSSGLIRNIVTDAIDIIHLADADKGGHLDFNKVIECLAKLFYEREKETDFSKACMVIKNANSGNLNFSFLINPKYRDIKNHPAYQKIKFTPKK